MGGPGADDQGSICRQYAPHLAHSPRRTRKIFQRFQTRHHAETGIWPTPQIIAGAKLPFDALGPTVGGGFVLGDSQHRWSQIKPNDCAAVPFFRRQQQRHTACAGRHIQRGGGRLRPQCHTQRHRKLNTVGRCDIATDSIINACTTGINPPHHRLAKIGAFANNDRPIHQDTTKHDTAEPPKYNHRGDYSRDHGLGSGQNHL